MVWNWLCVQIQPEVPWTPESVSVILIENTKWGIRHLKIPAVVDANLNLKQAFCVKPECLLMLCVYLYIMSILGTLFLWLVESGVTTEAYVMSVIECLNLWLNRHWGGEGRHKKAACVCVYYIYVNRYFADWNVCVRSCFHFGWTGRETGEWGVPSQAEQDTILIPHHH